MQRCPGHQIRAPARTIAVRCIFAPNASNRSRRNGIHDGGVHAASAAQVRRHIALLTRCRSANVGPPSIGKGAVRFFGCANRESITSPFRLRSRLISLRFALWF